MNAIKKHTLYKLLLGFFLAGTMAACIHEDIGSFTPKDPDMKLGGGDTLVVAKDTATYTVDIQSNLPWRVKTDADWVVLKTQNGLESGKTSFTVAKNPATQVRTAKLIVWITQDYQKALIIKQEAGDPLPDTFENYYVKTTGNAANDGLTWEKAVTLEKALELAGSNDKIHIAAGTYNPAVTVTGGSDADAGDKTFEIKNNVRMIGGYPADAAIGAKADPSTNTTTLNGTTPGGNAYHTVTVTAPIEEERMVVLDGINITGGKAAGSGAAALSINGLSYLRVNGGAMSIGRSAVVMKNCRIHENQAMQHTPGVYVFGGASVNFENCSVENNKGLSASGGNGGGIWNDGSTVYIINSTVSGNENSGVGGGIYAFNATIASKTYIYNSTIRDNKASHKTGFYGRENSETRMINCTVYGNVTKSATSGGAGISVYASATKAKLDMISCTITNNNSVGTSDVGSGGLRINDANCAVSISNSVISGNFSNGAAGDVYAPATITYAKSYSIVSDKAYDGAGTPVSGAVFDYAAMLGALANNGGATFTCRLQGAANPAATMGMTAAQLTTLGAGLVPAVAASVITFDQIGNSRAGKTTMGACVK